MVNIKIKFQKAAAAKQHRGMDELQEKYRHDWHGIRQPMEKQQASGNKQKKTINKWAGEQACHSNACTVPPNTNNKQHETTGRNFP